MKTCFMLEIEPGRAAIADLVSGRDMGLPPGTLILTRINVPVQCRGKGHGSYLLQTVLDAADAEQVTLALEVMPSGDLSFAQLELWYERHGFKYGQHGLMWRKPKEVKHAEEIVG